MFSINGITIHGVTIINGATMCGLHEGNNPMVVSQMKRPHEVVTHQPVIFYRDSGAIVVFKPLVSIGFTKYTSGYTDER